MPSVLYDVGDVVRSRAAFVDEDGAATSPTATTFKFSDPHGTTITYVYGTDAELVRDSTGNFHVDVTLDAWGLWRWQWTGTGTVGQAEQGTWTVRQTPLA